MRGGDEGGPRSEKNGDEKETAHGWLGMEGSTGVNGVSRTSGKATQAVGFSNPLLLYGNLSRLVADHDLKFPWFNDGVILRAEEGEVADGQLNLDGPAFTGTELGPGEGAEAFDRGGNRGKEVPDIEVYGFDSPALSGVGYLD